MDPNQKLFPDLLDGELPTPQLPSWHSNPVCTIPAVSRDALPKARHQQVHEICLALRPPEASSRARVVILHGPPLSGKSSVGQQVARRIFERSELYSPPLGGALWLDVERAASFRKLLAQDDWQLLVKLLRLGDAADIKNDAELAQRIQATLATPQEWAGKRLLLALHGSGMDVAVFKATIGKLAALQNVQVDACICVSLM